MEDKQLKEAIASLAKDKGKRDALAQMFVEYVQPHHLSVDFVSMILNSRALKEGDMLVKKIRKGITVRTLVPGSIHLASELTVRDRINYNLDGADVKVSYNAWELESGELGTVDEIRREMLAKLRDYYQNKVFSALSTIWSVANTPNNFVDTGGTISAPVLKAGIDYINQTAGGVKAVVGVRAALTPITEFGGFWAPDMSTFTSNIVGVDSQLEEVMRTGWLGTYYGARIVALEQEYDNPEDYTSLVPTDKVLIIGNKVGEFITYGDVKYKEWDDMRVTPPQWFLEFYQRFGLIIDNADGIYVIGGIT
jgi:hypothetical protein